MDERDTETFELSRAEARELIAALADARVGASGDEERRLRNVQSHLEVEFGFDEHRDRDSDGLLSGDEGWLDDGDLLDRGEDERIELSRTEADDVTDALADHEAAARENRETVEDLRERIVGAFEGR